ncbi:MAG: 2-succinyl-5-enolpyruvyl-6-hydroxy-3-cyclohexene-1-carboxylic-acid synthase [Candidatus Nitricoxidivorans perseverans]|uniref:2-succinyl-5-enolpyruvyl-6-hydroxy-3-cyclohexene-1-carboxylate synthase n=1 Tax=Candidatus Nitricoxidivorans perseverans TaxID=2975601 RepID=A0AA49FJU3_9PROT|nr:MAG: 2-succinyl-5-enolpyruvyl-6-hydroxy-3-cyclohexene-1-carboxylic-acid synthase [Candidatus Nitricoxidivorans perseverans]
MNNLAWADAFVAGLAAAGLRRAVIAPGARSSPLAAACLRRPELSCEVIADERVAGFFALGLARAEGWPAVVVTTSGTAAANLLPAVVEANLAGVPMIVLTADRPPEVHGWSANQTVDQARLYGVHVRAFHALPTPNAATPVGYLHALAARMAEESISPSSSSSPGPVHANLPFREPLLPDAIPPAPPLPSPVAVRHATAFPAEADAAVLAERLSGRRGAILCGEAAYPAGFGAAICALAARLGAPVLAEPLSNLRSGGLPVFARQSAFLRDANGFRPDWVLRFGGLPVSRTLERWLSGLTEAEHILVAPPGRWPDPLWRAGRLLRCDPLALVERLIEQPLRSAPGDWLEAFRAAEARLDAAARAACASDAPFEGSVAAALLSALPKGARCFVGNSLAIRAVDLFSGTGAKAFMLHGNRGASGIDGNIATAAGIAAGSGRPTAALIGDQAALHDCGGFAALAGRNAVIVVMNNGGGGIFDHLPLSAIKRAHFERAWVAPPRLDFAALAAAHGLAFHHAPTCAALAAALGAAFDEGGSWLIEVPIDRAVSKARFDAFFA